MAFDNLAHVNSFVSTNALTSQFIFVQIDSSNANSVVLPSAGGNAVGVTQDTPSAGDPTAVCASGSVTKVLCSASISIGQDIATDANGNAVPATSGAYVLGTAITVGTNGFLCDMLFQPKGIKEP